MGLHRAGFSPYGIDNKPQPHYPFPFLMMDALEAMDSLLRGGGLTFSNGETLYLADFDAYWASPPCQAYMDTNARGRKPTKHPRLIESTRERLQATGKPYIIENVPGAPLFSPVMLCGTMFGLRVVRHRLFECPSVAVLTTRCNHWGTVAHGDFVGVYARGGKGPRHGRGVREPGPRPAQVTAAEAMGIDWMTFSELTQAIPPAFSERIGTQLMKVLH